MIEYYIENPKLLSIRFEHDPYIVRLVKKLPDWRYDGDEKKWYIPLTPALHDPIFAFEEETNSVIPAHITKAIIDTKDFIRNNFIGSSAIAPNYNEIDKISPLFVDRLRPYQLAGVLYMLKNRTVIVADEMGLGKTVEALGTIESAHAYPALIICPANLKVNWFRECKTWIPNRPVHIIDKDDPGSAKNNFSDGAAQIVIVNYELLEKHKWLCLIPWECVIVDEAHYIKNPKAGRTVKTKRIADSAERVILMTGTPMGKRPYNLISLLDVTRKLHVLGGFWNFTQEYCNAQKTRFGWDFSGFDNLEELNVKLRECGYLRREKKQVLPELPEKIRQDLYIEIDNREDYDAAKIDFIKYLRKNRGNEAAKRAERAKVLVGINVLRQLAIEGKINAIFNWIEDFLETEQSIIIFGWHKEVLNAISEKFGCDVYNSETSDREKQGMIDRFQNGATKIIAINIQSGGVGLTLTVASYELFVELFWGHDVMQQAEDRAHRIGQKNALNIYRAIGENTIDEIFIKLINLEKENSDKATGNTDEIEFLIRELLREGE